MSVKIRVSYETPDEIDRVTRLLKPLGLKVRMPHKAETDSRFLRAYFDEPHRRGGRIEPPIEEQYPI